MKSIYAITLTGSLLLTGCAGMKSEFDCEATASNGCVTMDEANNKARAMTETSSPASLHSLPPLAAISVSETKTGTQAARAVKAAVSPMAPPVKRAPRNPFRGGVSSGYSAGALTESLDGTAPVRLPSTTARLWIAAWIDEQDVWHQPSVVSFEVSPSHWQRQQEVKG